MMQTRGSEGSERSLPPPRPRDCLYRWRDSSPASGVQKSQLGDDGTTAAVAGQHVKERNVDGPDGKQRF